MTRKFSETEKQIRDPEFRKLMKARVHKTAYWWARKDLHTNPATAKQIALAAIQGLD